MSKDNVVDIAVPGQVDKLLGKEVTTLREIIEKYEIKLPTDNYIFIMDIMIVCQPSELEKCVKIMRRDAKNYNHNWKWFSKEENNFFSYLYIKEGLILRSTIKELGNIDVAIVKRHCVKTYMNLRGSKVTLTTNIQVNSKTVGA